MFSRIVMAAGGVAMLALSAAAQDYNLPPTAGTAKLAAGFQPDPYTVAIQAGGPRNVADTVGGDCNGYVFDAPHLRVFYTAGADPLVFTVEAAADTTLLVNDANGDWLCDDDTGPGLNPAIVIDAPLSGQYDVWVGTAFGGAEGVAGGDLSGTLMVTATAPAADGAAALDFTLPAINGDVTLAAGFTPDPHMTEVVAGGEVRAEEAAEGCLGDTTAAPTLRLYYTAGSYPLHIYAMAAGDTTLIVNDPAGNWVCDDDTGGNLNPSITFDAPVSGQYDIWVGAYGEGLTFMAGLYISELPPPAVVDINRPPDGGGVLDRTLDPIHGTATLPAGFRPTPREMAVDVGGNATADTLGEGCRGYVTEAPTYRINYTAGGIPLAISAFSEIDMTLVVADPEGNWRCDDDSAEGFNPLVLFESPTSGQYDIWVGLYSLGQGAPVPGTLRIEEVAGAAAVTGGTVLDMTLPPIAGEANLAAGFTPDPFTMALAAGGPIDGQQAVAEECWGNFSAAPSLVLNYDGTGPLSIWVESTLDTTLIVNTPSGDWFCNDDGGVEETPVLHWDEALRGSYHIWVGVFRGPGGQATLNVSETMNPTDPTPDPPVFMKLPGG